MKKYRQHREKRSNGLIGLKYCCIFMLITILVIRNFSILFTFAFQNLKISCENYNWINNFTMLELAPRRIFRIKSKARNDGNILRGSTLLIGRFANPGWHHQLKKTQNRLNENSVGIISNFIST